MKIKKNKRQTIFVTVNTAIDALKTTVSKTHSHPVLEKIRNDRMILLTAHRRENLGDPMRNMFRAISQIVNEHNDLQVVYPVHLNPVVRETAKEILGNNPRVHLIEPLEVIDFHNFLSRAHIILTDSGGIQEEAPSLGVPVLVLRDTTERPEGIKAGTLKLADREEKTIYTLNKTLLTDQTEYDKMSRASNPYGDGNASYRIVQAILYHFGKTALPPEQFLL
jgi:UDP-N-acetylglucosamine 2-epimerase (non-hydrolysing)